MAAASMDDVSAKLSASGRYRFDLYRRWNVNRPMLVWIMLNPSTADAEEDDPTIRRVCGFSRDWGYGAVLVLNRYPFRATSPQDLKHWYRRMQETGDWGARDAMQDNANWIEWQLHTYAMIHLTKNTEPPPVICAWGASGPDDDTDSDILANIEHQHCEAQALGFTKSGRPVHPLYQPKTARLVPYRPAQC